MSDQKEKLLPGVLVEKLTGLRSLFASFVCRKAELDDQSIKIIRDYNEKGSWFTSLFRVLILRC